MGSLEGPKVRREYASTEHSKRWSDLVFSSLSNWGVYKEFWQRSYFGLFLPPTFLTAWL